MVAALLVLRRGQAPVIEEEDVHPGELAEEPAAATPDTARGATCCRAQGLCLPRPLSPFCFLDRSDLCSDDALHAFAQRTRQAPPAPLSLSG